MDGNGATAGPGVGPLPTGSLQKHVAHAQDARTRLISDLRSLLTEEQLVAARLAEQLAESRQRADRTRKALEQLSGEPTPMAKRVPRKSEKRTYRPKQANMEAVLALLQDAEQPLSTTQLEQGSGLSVETIHRALKYLRAEQKVRLVESGKRGSRGHGAVYAPMPEAPDA